MKIDTVQQRTRKPSLIVFGATRCPAARRFGEMTAAARVHRRNQLETRRIGDASLGPRDADAASLKRLPKGFECRAVELRQLVKEQNAYYITRVAREGIASQG